jgi:hypothetical protein
MAWPERSIGFLLPRCWLLLSALAGLAPPVGAVTFCCNDDGGRRLCGDILPAQCAKRGYQEYNSLGVMIRQHDAPMTAEQRAQQRAEIARKKEADRQAAEEDRRNRALLASYPSVADIDTKRARNIEEAGKGLHELQLRLNAALARKEDLAREAEFFLKRPMPADLKTGIRDNNAELVGLQADIDVKKKEIAEIQARFDDEKKRYLSLGKGAATPKAGPETGAEPRRP